MGLTYNRLAPWSIVLILGQPLFAKDIVITALPVGAQIISVDAKNPASNKVLGTGSVLVKTKG